MQHTLGITKYQQAPAEKASVLAVAMQIISMPVKESQNARNIRRCSRSARLECTEINLVAGRGFVLYLVVVVRNIT